MATKSPAEHNQKSPLTRLFARQKSKVRNTSRKAHLLKVFAEEDHKRIAQLIQVWLEDDEKRTSSR